MKNFIQFLFDLGITWKDVGRWLFFAALVYMCARGLSKCADSFKTEYTEPEIEQHER